MAISNYIPSSRLAQSGVCTSTTRPASPYEGQVIYETDTNKVFVYDNSAWVQIIGKDFLCFAAKSGPTTWVSAYKARWNKGYGVGSSLDATGNTDGITVVDTGFYEVHAAQRSSGGDMFMAIGVNGDRSALENRANGVWSHDHAADAGAWAKGYYLGELNAGELITAGAPSSGGNVTYNALGYAGFLSIKRIA